MKKVVTYLGVAAIALVGGYVAKDLIVTKQPVLLIIAETGYQPLEYSLTRREIENAGFNVTVASNGKAGTQATPSAGDLKTNIDVTVADVNPDGYAGIFIVGGPGALEALDNNTTIKLMERFAATGKPFGAICISPRILANAGLLNGKKATGWNDDKNLTDIFTAHSVTYVQEHVVIDGNIITADGPRAATTFGKKIVELLKKP